MKFRFNKISSFSHFLHQVLNRFISDSGPQRAAGLAYSTLMALVPLLAIFIGFGGPLMMTDAVQTFLAETLLPAMQAPIMNAILEFAKNSRKLGVMGTPVFLVTVLFLLNNIEVTLNHIFRVGTDRHLLPRIITYTSVIIFAGLFISASITLSTDMIEQVLQKLGYTWISPIFKRRVASFLFIFLGQFVLLTLIPGRRVHPKSAFTAAVAGAILWELTKRVFSFWANQSVRMSVIYGSLFMFPLMLIWLMIVWIILLLMAELTYVHQHWSYYSRRDNHPRVPGENFINSLRLYSLILQLYRASKPAPDITSLSKSLNIPERHTEELLEPLLRDSIILKVILKAKTWGYVPSGPLKNQTLVSLLFSLNNFTSPAPGFNNDSLINALKEEISDRLEGVSIEELLENHEG